MPQTSAVADRTYMTEEFLLEYRLNHQLADDDNVRVASAAARRRDEMFAEYLAENEAMVQKYASRAHRASHAQGIRVDFDDFWFCVLNEMHKLMLSMPLEDPKAFGLTLSQRAITATMNVTAEANPRIGAAFTDVRRSLPVAKARALIAAEGGDDTCVKTIAARTELTEQAVDRIINTPMPMSLDISSADDDSVAVAPVDDGFEDDVVASLMTEEIHDLLIDVIPDETERMVFIYRTGIGCEPMQIIDLAERMGMTEAQVKGIVRRVRGNLTHPACPISVLMAAV